MAGVDEQDAPALGRLHRLLQDLPGHHRGAAEAVADPLRVGGQEAVARPVVEAVPGDEQHHRVGLLGLLQQVDGIEDVAGGRQLGPVGAVDQHALDHLGVRRAQPPLGRLHQLARVGARVAADRSCRCRRRRRSCRGPGTGRRRWPGCRACRACRASPSPSWLRVMVSAFSPMALVSVMRMSLRPLPSGTSSVRSPALKPPEPISGVISSTWRPLTCTRITLIGIGHRLDVDLHLGAAAALAGARGRRDDAELRHRPRQQVGQLEGGARRLAHGLLGGGQDDGLLDDVGPVQVRPQLVGADVVGGVLRPLVDLPADDLVGARRARVVALRRPHHPFAVACRGTG